MIRWFQQFMPQLAPDTFVAESAHVIGRVTLASGVSIWDTAVLRGDMGDINIAENSNVQDGAVIHNTEGMPVTIGNFVTVGHRAVLHSCTIGNNTLIGMGAIILDGAKIGNNCLIGAGSVVTPKTMIPDGSVVMGTPAKVVKPITDETIAANKENAMEYVKLISLYREEVTN